MSSIPEKDQSLQTQERLRPSPWPTSKMHFTVNLSGTSGWPRSSYAIDSHCRSVLPGDDELKKNPDSGEVGVTHGQEHWLSPSVLTSFMAGQGGYAEEPFFGVETPIASLVSNAVASVSSRKTSARVEARTLHPGRASQGVFLELPARELNLGRGPTLQSPDYWIRFISCEVGSKAFIDKCESIGTEEPKAQVPVLWVEWTVKLEAFPLQWLTNARLISIENQARNVELGKTGALATWKRAQKTLIKRYCPESLIEEGRMKIDGEYIPFEKVLSGVTTFNYTFSRVQGSLPLRNRIINNPDPEQAETFKAMSTRMAQLAIDTYKKSQETAGKP